MSGPDSHSVTEVPAVAELERDPRAAPTLLVTLIGTILLLAVVLTAQLLFQSAEWIHETAPESPKNPELAKIQSEQLAAISQYRLLDPAKGIVAVPIDDAMRLFAADQRAGALPARMSASAPSTAAAGLKTSESRPGTAP